MSLATLTIGGCLCPCCQPVIHDQDWCLPLAIEPAVDTFAHLALAVALFGWLP